MHSGNLDKLTAEPFITVDRQDFIDCELSSHPGLSGVALERAVKVMEDIQFVEPERVMELSELLFMAVGGLNNVSGENRLLAAGASNQMQRQISSYIV